MEVGSRAGYYTSKSPKMILHEWCNRDRRVKPRYKTIAMEDGRFRCKVGPKPGCKSSSDRETCFRCNL